jgi:hypothetical protein
MFSRNDETDEAPSIAPFNFDRFGTVPIGAVTYENRVGLVEEALVVTVSILAHRRCDLVIMDW